MLLKTGVTLDLIYDEELYEMVEKGLRGGMCQVSKRRAEANNKYMNEMYDENKPSCYTNYLDANNLYGLAMCQKLPYKDIKFVNDFKEEHINSWTDNNVGFLLDVDLEYPKELHDKHVDYPLAPEIMNVEASMLSETQKKYTKNIIIIRNSETKKQTINIECL